MNTSSSLFSCPATLVPLSQLATRVPIDTTAMATPKLYQDLRTALACLYSLSPSTATPQIDPRAAHDFLMNLQSRNVRRKLHSIQQSDRALSKQKEVGSASKLAEEVEGSTWLACLALLCCPHAESEERMFASQTLMHRLRRAKLMEAIDLEIEDPNKYLSPQLDVNLQLLATDYAEWMQQFHPVLSRLVTISNANNEEQLKGELTMLTLAAIMYLMASHYSNDANVQPLIFTLSNALAVTALRLRFTPQSVSSCDNNKATPTSAPLVTMMLQSLSAAATDSNMNSSALFRCLCSCLGVIPEALLSSSGGAMGRISIDPRCIQAAHEELRQPVTGMYLMWEALRHENLDNEVVIANLLVTCQKWAKCLPLPQDFVEYTVPLANRLLVSSSSHSKMAALSYLIAIYESGAWTFEYILTFSLGLSSEQLSTAQSANKKRQTSRSKRRQQERIDTTATDDLRMQAKAECRHRGEMACLATRLVWDGLSAAVRLSLATSNFDGEGPVGCLCACANACLPHWLRHSSSEEDAALAVSIMTVIQEIASHSERSVRALVYEPLYTLNTALLEAARVRNAASLPPLPPPPTRMETVVANHLFQVRGIFDCNDSTMTLLPPASPLTDALFFSVQCILQHPATIRLTTLTIWLKIMTRRWRSNETTFGT